MTQHISLVGAKGGSGTSTVASLVALEASKDRKVYLDGDIGDLCALLGVPNNDLIAQVSESLYVGSTGAAVQNTDLYVHDAGVLQRDTEITGTAYLVTRPCYLALRRAMEIGVEGITGVVLLVEPGRAFERRDVEAVFSKPVVASLEVNESTARMIDAGLLAMRPPRSSSLASLVPALVTA